MIGVLLFLAAFGASEKSVALVELLGDPQKALLVKRVEDALESEPELLAQHRGYVRFLEAHPDLATAEWAFAPTAAFGGAQGVLAPFEETLNAEPGARDRFLDHLRYLANSPEALDHVDGLAQVEHAHPRLRGELAPAMAYIKAHPGDALAVLRSATAATGTETPLAQLLQRFVEMPELRTQLVEHLEALETMDKATEPLFAWWRTAFADEGNLALAHRRLNTYFGRFPEFWSTWQKRNAAWASEPDAFAWAQYLNGLARRASVLGPEYFAYRAVLAEFPVIRDAAERDWQTRLGDAAAWPPSGTPPTLPATTFGVAPGPRVPATPETIRPARPTIPGPSRPASPTTPTRPQRPVFDPQKSSRVKPSP